MVYVIGDSHSLIYQSIQGLKVIYIGSKLMWSVSTKDEFNFAHNDVNEGDTVIFCFGEIDCRSHIYKHSRNRPYQDVLDELSDHYRKFLLSKQEEYKIKICVNNIVPPVRSEPHRENSEVPFEGSDEERRSYTVYLNNRLKEFCEVHNFLYIDIYDHFTTEDGFMNPSMADNSVHINDPKYLNNFLVEHSIIEGSILQ